MKNILTVQNLCKNQIIKDVSFSIEEGEMVAVMGPSGSGKSTLLYNVSGMDTADAGSVILDGSEVTHMSEDEKAKLRLENMGFVFQQMNVLSNLNVIDNIMFPALHSKTCKLSKLQIRERAIQLMRDFSIEELAKREVTEVSGGQLQRVCICRSLMLEPQILFADEPTGALNQSAAAEVIDAFLQINMQGTTILMVTHDSKVAGKCDRILYILDGQLQGELKLSKYREDCNTADRERKVNEWLEEKGW